MRGMYGQSPATFHLNGLPGSPDRGKFCSVHLDKDPGSGSMNLYNISTTQIVITEATPEQYRAVAASIRNSATYLTPKPGGRFSEMERLIMLADRYDLAAHGEPS